MLVEAGSDSGRRTELINSLFRLTAAGRGAVIDWTPVEQASALALAKWNDILSPEDSYTLQFAHAVAARHENNRGDIALPDPTWLKRQPLPLRVGLVAHFVQQCADTGVPESASVEKLARPFLQPDAHEAFGPQLKLAGALARLLAVTGGHEEALHIQEKCATAFFEGMDYAEVSFPLTEWLRLSGACGEKNSFEKACDMEQRVRAFGGLGLNGSPYVELARCKAAIMLGIPDSGDVVRSLSNLATAASVPAHIRWSATRWLTRAFDEMREKSSEDLKTSEAIMKKLIETMNSGANDAAQAKIFYTLIRLEQALEKSDSEAVAENVNLLCRYEPGPIGHIRASATGKNAAAAIARYYPY